MTGVRGAVARHMAESAQTTAMVTSTTEVDATELVRLREALREEWRESPGYAPSYNDLLVVILAKALRENPYVNAHIVGDEIHQYPYANIGIAVDIERGLIVPVIKGAETMNLAQVAHTSRELVAKARSGKLLPDEISGGTFTISNMGMFEVDVSTPILNLPEVAILGVGRIAARPTVVDNQICIRQTMTLSLTYDHRAVDGAPAARFLTRLKVLIERPALVFVAAG
jgi:pyruvate dehydrogenase E2 component (dihydrolipoamide acetyltransferase)